MTNSRPQRHGVPAVFDAPVWEWLAKALTFNVSSQESSAGLQSPVPSCHFYVDHKYRILYVRTSKTAGTTISHALGFKENPLVCAGGRRRCFAKCEGRQVCMEYVFDLTQLRKIWPTYTVFSFVRNPWSRAVSSWHHLHKYSVRRSCRSSFPSFARAPSLYAAKCFVSPSCCRQRFGWMLEHLEPQAPCLFDYAGQPAVDFLGRVELLEEDMKDLVGLINSRLSNGTALLQLDELPRMMVTAPRQQQQKQQLELVPSRSEAAHAAHASEYVGSRALYDIFQYYRQDFEQLQFATPWGANTPG